MASKIKAMANKCSGCGDNLEFNPDASCLSCPSCKNMVNINSTLGMPKHKLNEEKLSSHKNNSWASLVKSMQCPNCGAKVVLQTYETSASCPYCATSLIATKQMYDGIKPDSIIPFAFGKEKATEIFKQTIKNKWLVPKELKNSVSAEEVFPFYIPTFIFDAECSTSYNGRLFRYEDGEDEKGTQRKRKYFTIEGKTDTTHNNIEIEASTKLTQFELNSIKPFNFEKANIYTDEFIYGYGLECYSNSLNETNNQAKTIIKQEIKNNILRDYKYDGIDYLDMLTTYKDEKYNYCILPVYRFNYSYKNKQYSNLMNGQTGKLGGDYPKSALKISLIVILSLLLVFVPIIAIIMAVI